MPPTVMFEVIVLPDETLLVIVTSVSITRAYWSGRLSA